MTSTFDLLERPWIPVRWLDANVELVGLRTAFSKADQIGSLECSNPVRQISMLRLLLAVCHRAQRLADIDAAVERLEEDWPSDVFKAYFDLWVDRFDLYGNERPFLQVPWLKDHEKTANRIQEVARITVEWAAGNTKLLMDHHQEGGGHSHSAAEAAQILVAYQQFCPGGLSKVFKDSAAGGPGMGFAHVWVTAPTLARMLTLNQLLQSEDEYQADRPAWELDVPGPEKIIDTQPIFQGPASRYAHLTRSILLRPEAEGRCRSLYWAEGITRDANPMSADPMEARRPSKTGDWLPVRLS
jgi:CRISPR system Cascade subunit CasA